jgi:uncharacterized DUF497 family protein
MEEAVSALASEAPSEARLDELACRPSASTAMLVDHTDAPENFRIISARTATQERRRYELGS